MITCNFEDGGKGHLRHVVAHAIVEKDGKILLEKRSEGLLEAGKWSFPGGFLGRDETAGEAALRELYEETGWKGEIVSLFRINSSPNRPKEDRQNIAIEFIIKPLEKTGEGDHESTKVEWIAFGDIRFEDMAFDHGETIKLYMDYKEKQFNLPIVV